VKDDRVYLNHIRECMDRIAQYTATGRAAFDNDTLIQDAVLRNLHTMAESTQRLSAPLKARHPEVEWAAIAGFRNVLVHDYLGINLNRVWEIVENDLPDLKPHVDGMLAELGAPRA
jgi:uncharacterized protein with HEPN domain